MKPRSVSDGSERRSDSLQESVVEDSLDARTRPVSAFQLKATKAACISPSIRTLSSYLVQSEHIVTETRGPYFPVKLLSDALCQNQNHKARQPQRFVKSRVELRQRQRQRRDAQGSDPGAKCSAATSHYTLAPKGGNILRMSSFKPSSLSEAEAAGSVELTHGQFQVQRASRGVEPEAAAAHWHGRASGGVWRSGDTSFLTGGGEQKPQRPTLCVSTSNPEPGPQSPARVRPGAFSAEWRLHLMNKSLLISTTAAFCG
ncbi:uncharacterized protein V6R79_006396 [Siganus canaliculatus]